VNRELGVRLLRVGLSAALLYIVLDTVGIEQLVDPMRELEIGLVLLAVALFTSGAFLHALRWSYVLHALGCSKPYLYVVREMWIGYFFNQLLPTSMGGDGVRVYRLYRANVPLDVSVQSVLVERLFAFAACVILSMPAAIYMLMVAPQDLATVLVLVAIIVSLIAGLLLLLPFPTIDCRLPAAFRRGVHTLRKALTDPRLAIKSMGASAAMHLVAAATLATLAGAVGLAADAWKVALFTPPVVLLMTVPVSFAGWGVREGVMVVVLGVVGFSSAIALALGLLLGLVTILTSLPGALFIALEPSVTDLKHRSIGKDTK
jgi:glycosyltransferase 2 family protein